MSNLSEKEKKLIVKKDGTGTYCTIQDAVKDALPGDTILVFGGIYREEVVFPKGGTDEASRITLKAAESEAVTVTGANQITDGWIYDESKGTYILTLEKEYFSVNAEGEYFNPFSIKWKSKGFKWSDFFTCGCVYINDIVMQQTWTTDDMASTPYSWFATVDPKTEKTSIYANFGSDNPCSSKNNVEINVRMQCITARWNQGYITIDGLNITRGCGPKTIDFWMTTADAMYGAIATNGGHHWILEHCNVYQCRGVAIDFGCGSAKQELKYGGEPTLYGHHIIRHNDVHDNGTNGMMAYRGAYTEIHHNTLTNNNALNTGLLSEAYIKDVSGGWGLYIHDNYLYSDQEWSAFPIWLDSECDMCRFSKNIVYCLGEGKGFSSLNYECNGGWNLIDNNILVGIGYTLCTSVSTYFINNLWLDMEENSCTWPSKMSTRCCGSEGFDGYTRTMRLAEAGTLNIIGKDSSSRWQMFNNDSKMFNNIFFGQGLTHMPGKRNDSDIGGVSLLVESMFCSPGPSLEPAKHENSIYGEMVLNPLGNPDYSGGTWKSVLPHATSAEREGALQYKDIYAWIPVDEETNLLFSQQMAEGNAYSPYGNECDYNAYFAGAGLIDEPGYGAAHGYIADSHSVVSKAGNYNIIAAPNSFELTITMDETLEKMEVPLATGQFLGGSSCYDQAASKYIAAYQESEYLPEDVSEDFFGAVRSDGGNIAGPFIDLTSGTTLYKCWPKK